MQRTSQRKIVISTVFIVWLGAAALACAILTPGDRGLEAEDFLLAAPDASAAKIEPIGSTVAAPIRLPATPGQS